MTHYVIYFDICAFFLSIVLLIMFFGKKDRHRVHNRIFEILLIDELVMSTADVMSAAMIVSPNALDPTIRAVTSLFNYLYLIPHTMIPVIFSSYIMIMIGYSKKVSKKFMVAFVIPYLIVLGFLLTNPFTGAIFTSTETNPYIRGPFMPLLYLGTSFYVVVAVTFLIRYRNSLPSSKLIPLFCFIVISIIATLLQFIFPKYLIECFFQVLMTVYLLITIENPSELYNADSNVYNRRTFIMDNINLLRNNVKYRLIVIKILNTEYYMTTLGVTAMNEILRDLAQWLRRITSDDSVYDCNNGVFTLLLNEKQSKRTDQIIQYLENRFSTDMMYKSRILTLKTQICQVDVPDDARSIDAIVTVIDSPGTKEESRVIMLKNDQLNYIQRRRAIEKAIDHALETDAFKVHFQPIWDAKHNKIHSAEALIRLYDDELGYISPEEFIPIAEQNGRIITIGQFVFEEVCRMFTMHQLETIGLNLLEINLSTVQCMHRTLPQIFKNTLGHYSLPPIAINLEITESAAINSQEDFLKTINELHDMGFSFSLDDYGTGYSNATYILSMDFDIIKIDKAILWQSEKSESAKIVLRNTVRMIKELGKKILVEGVETKEQMEAMVELGVDYCQGFYFSKPVPQQEFIAFCREFNRSH